jgi:hypothetical protein
MDSRELGTLFRQDSQDWQDGKVGRTLWVSQEWNPGPV